TNDIGERKFLHLSLNQSRHELFQETAACSDFHVETLRRSFSCFGKTLIPKRECVTSRRVAARDLTALNCDFRSVEIEAAQFRVGQGLPQTIEEHQGLVGGDFSPRWVNSRFIFRIPRNCRRQIPNKLEMK